MQTLLRLTNAALLPAVFTLLVLWLLGRTWKAFDDSRPYPMRTLKLCGWLLAFGALERLIASFTV